VLLVGLRNERYATWAGAPSERTDFAMEYLNRPMVHALDGRRTFSSTGDYLGFVADHPVGVTMMYGRHLVNGLDTRFGGSNIHDLDERAPVAAVVNFAALAVGAAFALFRWRTRVQTEHVLVRWSGPAAYTVIVLVATMVPSIFAAMENRFLIAVHLALLTSAALCTHRSDVPSSRRGAVGALAAMAAVVALFFVVSNSTLDKLSPGGERPPAFPIPVDPAAPPTTVSTVAPAP
jgi:hypothetical protein